MTNEPLNSTRIACYSGYLLVLFSLSSISFKKINGFGILTTLLAKDTLSQTNIISQTAIYDKENLQWPNACDLNFECC